MKSGAAWLWVAAITMPAGSMPSSAPRLLAELLGAAVVALGGVVPQPALAVDDREDDRVGAVADGDRAHPQAELGVERRHRVHRADAEAALVDAVRVLRPRAAGVGEVGGVLGVGAEVLEEAGVEGAARGRVGLPRAAVVAGAGRDRRLGGAGHAGRPAPAAGAGGRGGGAAAAAPPRRPAPRRAPVDAGGGRGRAGRRRVGAATTPAQAAPTKVAPATRPAAAVRRKVRRVSMGSSSGVSRVMAVPLVSPKASTRPPARMTARSPAARLVSASQRSPWRTAAHRRGAVGPATVTVADTTSAPDAHGRKLQVRHSTVPPSSATYGNGES